jgi:steroid delta-isomerase
MPSSDLLHRAVAEFFAAIAAVDPPRIAAAFAEQGEIEDPVGSEIVRGRANIEASFANGFAKRIRSAEVETLATEIAGDSIEARWRLGAVGTSGRRAEAEGIDVVTVDSDGLITRVAGYWDPKPFLDALEG